LSWGAQDAIRDELRAVSHLDIETGGFLFGLERRLFHAEIVHATGPGPTSRHSRGSVMIGEVADVRAEFGEFTARADLKARGCWHSHPWGSGSPSPADLNAWRIRLEESGWDQWVGVIATRDPDGHGWTYPRFHAWLLRSEHDAPGRWKYVCEPVRVDEL
jgi:Prokaryotic homologs of the JAB domain